MRLWIGRHGEASFNAPSDRERPLTPNGIGQTRMLARKHARNLSNITEIWSSPLRRAQETAALYAKMLDLSIETRTFLSPDTDPERVVSKLSECDSGDELLIISHQPLVGELVSLLVAGNIYESHPFSTSELVLLELDLAGPGLATQVASYLPD